MNVYRVKTGSILPLGKQGENLARKIQFDISRWIGSFGPGTVQLLHQRSGDPYPYPVVVTQTGNEVLWNITATDTAMVGLGRCELQFYLGGVLAKSENWYTKVFDSISASGDVIPDPEVSWVTEVIQAGAVAKEQAARAEAAAEKAEAATVNVPILGDNGNWFVWDKTIGEYVDTGVYSGGEAPYIGANGNWFIGTNDSGVSATGPRGPVGPEGPRGVQGEKGDAFSYEDFTPEQLKALKGAKGDPFTYEDFTADQLESLRGPAGTNGVTPHIWSNGNWYIGNTDTGIPATGPQGPAGPALAVTNTAAVGQTIRVSAVDKTGQPTEWEAVDMASGGGGSGETWETIDIITLSDAVNTVTINRDSGGNAIALKKVRILAEGSATSAQDLFLNSSRYIRASVVGTAASVGALSAEPFCGNMLCFAVPNIAANFAALSQVANIFSDELTITEIKLIVNNSGTFSAGTKFTIQGVRA